MAGSPAHTHLFCSNPGGCLSALEACPARLRELIVGVFRKGFSRLSVYTILYTMNYRKELSECILRLASQAQLEDQLLCLIQTICFKHTFSKGNSTNALIKVSIIITTFFSIFDSHFFQLFFNFLLSKRITKLTNETKCHSC